MNTKTLVIGLTLVVALGGGYLFWATRGQTTAATPAPATTAPAEGPAPTAPRPARALDGVAPAPAPTATAPALPSAVPTTTPTVARPLPVGTPGVHLDVRDRLDDAPGLAEPTRRADDDLAAAPTPVADEATAALAEARAAFRAGDYASARSLTTKLLGIAPTNDAARRLAVSAACRLRDVDGARTAAAGIAPDQRAAVVRYCATAGVSLDSPP